MCALVGINHPLSSIINAARCNTLLLLLFTIWARNNLVGGGRAEHSWQKERKAQQIHKHTQKHSQRKVLALSSLLSSSSNSSSTSMVESFFPSFLPLVLITPFMIEEEGFSESEWESMHDLKKKPHSIIHNNKQPSSRLSIGPSCAQRERERERERVREFGCQELYQFAFFKTN